MIYKKFNFITFFILTSCLNLKQNKLAKPGNIPKKQCSRRCRSALATAIGKFEYSLVFKGLRCENNGSCFLSRIDNIKSSLYSGLSYNVYVDGRTHGYILLA
jgi:hypothetical protein